MLDESENSSVQENQIPEGTDCLKATATNDVKNVTPQIKQIITTANRTSLTLLRSDSNENLLNNLCHLSNEGSMDNSEPLRFSLSLETEDCLPSVDSISPQNCPTTNVSPELTPDTVLKNHDFSLSEAFFQMTLSTPVKRVAGIEVTKNQAVSPTRNSVDFYEGDSISQNELPTQSLPNEEVSQSVLDQNLQNEGISTTKTASLPSSPFKMLLDKSLTIIGAVASSISTSGEESANKIESPSKKENSLQFLPQDNIVFENLVLSSENSCPALMDENNYLSCCNGVSDVTEISPVIDHLPTEAQKAAIQNNLKEDYYPEVETVSPVLTEPEIPVTSSDFLNQVDKPVGFHQPIVIESVKNDEVDIKFDDLTSKENLIENNSSMLMEFSVLNEDMDVSKNLAPPEVAGTVGLPSVFVSTNLLPVFANLPEVSTPELLALLNPASKQIEEASDEIVFKVSEDIDNTVHSLALEGACQSGNTAKKNEMPNSNTKTEIDTELTLPQEPKSNCRLDCEVPVDDFAFEVPANVLEVSEDINSSIHRLALEDACQSGNIVERNEMPDINVKVEINTEFTLPEKPKGNSELNFEVPMDDFGFKVPLTPNTAEGGACQSGNIVERSEMSSINVKAEIDTEFTLPEEPKGNGELNFEVPMDDFGFKVPLAPNTAEDGEQFADAVQFFQDPSSFQYLENIETSNKKADILRSSLFVNFDPLHSRASTQSRQDNCALITQALQKSEKEKLEKNVFKQEVRKSTGNVLISFDSPIHVGGESRICTTTPPKLYTEDELQQQLKTHELLIEEAYLQKQREMEEESTKKLQEMADNIQEKDDTIARLNKLAKSQKLIMEEMKLVICALSDRGDVPKDKMKLLQTENLKLKEDVKTVNEDLLGVEQSFADLHKRYEQIKVMVKTYKENEVHLKQETLDCQNKVKEHEQMNRVSKERTNELLEKANAEVESVKKAGDTQITVLKAQLKKAEMKISGLESDINKIKVENNQLEGICNDLMVKVGES